ncbi:UDP-N-acetylmuramate--L-alanyl-gamma-D-glutamyl-meso-2,6-diaminoheptandioate ligase [Luteitalea sp. TBR-22]|uniref:UDP-N-acetylmuramate:L-alanyl-gamma-D-glutamyl- meso-diaminopimelate ligase n=1 Tax=Luteitalea sp. TBR-22 TaxID=2802971 RepID=UPI001AF8E523|nr:UDP-N-acetylmuramate:L-alanyl-gamma-D-glutamyl-meso-diaminopimelate ligase [Luteitalea sp. TBR-22]BCS33879.1 UDP-N-acetylmuramate--L-alanyl-gamma-D-glutamyl-meso-2,6-diaminoheptandioate ligase [Luteitalea sp. TBR-22]
MHIHLIGVAGTAMATLAAMLQRRGHRVTGSDAGVYPPMSDFLRAEAIEVHEGYAAEHVDPSADLVVVGNAISRGNPELEAVLARRQRYCSLPERIRDEFLWERHPIVVSGTHGKTTTTSLVAWVLTHAGLDPSLLVGGIAANFEASYRLGHGRDFVIEGDEYDSAFFDKTAKFLKYVPHTVIVNNVEFDHADIYADLEAIVTAFTRLLRLVPSNGRVLLGADDPVAASLRRSAYGQVETFGLTAGADWQARALRPSATATTFEVVRRGEVLGDATVPMTGEHNVRNALAALAVAATRGVPFALAAEGMSRFAGVKRRMELRGTARGVSVYDDFAHHPTAIAETLRGVRRAHPGARIWAVFEPRSASSCRRVFQDAFAGAFGDADEVVIASAYRTNLPPEERLSVPGLVDALLASGRRARHIDGTAHIIATVAQEAREGDLVVVMSNGGFDDIHARLLEALGAGPQG